MMVRPHNKGVKTLLFNEGQVLMVKIGYAHKKWVFPGGAIDKGEDAEAAAKRELFEESGCVDNTVQYIGEKVWHRKHGTVTTQYFYATTNARNLSIDDQEIIDAGWFSLDQLPEDRTERVDEEIALYNNWNNGKH
jgi:8-oxo-dGTP pyrophosphatase MutT (NUDIX family)